MTDNTEPAQIGWRFWLLWVLLSTVGAAVGVAVYILMYFLCCFVSSTTRIPADTSTITGVMAGFLVGGAQWLVLWRHVGWAGWWVLATTVGFAVVFAVDAAVFGEPGYLALVVAPVSAAIIGPVLVWLFPQPVPEEPSRPEY